VELEIREVCWMGSVLRGGIILGLLAISSVAFAQDHVPSAEDIKAAAEEFDMGRRAFKARDYVEAAEHFESANQSAPSAAALELAIRSRERAGQLERAATLAALAERRHPDEGNLKTLADGVLKKARAELHEAKVTCNTPCDIVVDNKIVHGHTTSEWTVFFDAGKHVVRAGWPGGRGVDEEISAERGGSSETTFEEPPPEVRPDAAPMQPGVAPGETGQVVPVTNDQGVVVRPKGWSPVVFFTGVGVTAVLGGLTVWSGLDTVNNPGKDVVRRECAGRGTACPEYQDGLDKQRRTNILAAGTGVAGVVTVLIGVLATDWSGKAKEAAALAPGRSRSQANGIGVQPWIGINSGATLGATGKF
jgi:hypothetical protein